MVRNRCASVVALLVGGWCLLGTSQSLAQVVPGEKCAPEVVAPVTFHFEEQAGEQLNGPICFQTFTYCGQPMVVDGPSYKLLDAACEPVLSTCKYQVRIGVEFPGNQQSIAIGLHHAEARWFSTPTAPDCDGTTCQM